VAGPASPRALLLPGLHGSGRLFAPLLAAEPRFEHEALSYPADEPLGLDALVALVRGRLPPVRFLLVAESFAGPIAVRLAAERPAGLAGLVLAATFLHAPLPAILRPAGLLAARSPFALPLPSAAVRLLLTGTDAPSGIVEEVRREVAAVAPAVLAGRMADSLAVDVREDLARVDAPILFLAPTRDRLVRTDAFEDVLAIRPDADVVPIEGPHMILQRCPHASLARIEEFGRRTA